MSFERPDSPFLEISNQEFRLWQHNPLTAAFLQFLDDNIAVFREQAADLVETGQFRAADPAEFRNPDVVRGKIAALRDLRGIALQDIQGFYGKEPAVESGDAEPDVKRDADRE